MIRNFLNEWNNPVFDFDADDEMILVIALVIAEFLTAPNSVSDKTIEQFVNHNRPLFKYCILRSHGSGAIWPTGNRRKTCNFLTGWAIGEAPDGC